MLRSAMKKSHNMQEKIGFLFKTLRNNQKKILEPKAL